MHPSFKQLAAALLLILTVAGLPMLVTPAGAHNWSGTTGYTGCANGSPVNRADNATHTIHYIDLKDHVRNMNEWVRNNVLEPAGFKTSVQASPNSLTDVLVRDRYYVDYCGFNWWNQSKDSGVIGLATCDKLSPTSRCETHTLRYNLHWTDLQGVALRRRLACHEHGHGIGLQHRSTQTGCMPAMAEDWAVSDYSPHDKNHLTNNY
ncbi:hypothetical protein [Microbacterium sp.]|uniref:hypothetical protein n=1 Tax=Microbacterium sp. TaxID=51671 RepID=UPI002736EAD3|nr:hypothetical protein [Microbacterium sp.]MDP3953197.1 hypothetical protein [Microbacterium sp.]